MISFLRKIRKSLIGSGTTQKYLLYAIGEIALVVIGILIALQINNWNEYQQDREIELKVLRQIKQNLILDMSDHNDNMVNVDGVVRSSTIILDHLNQDLPYHDSLNAHFGWLPMAANFDAVRSGYDMMLSVGVNIVQDDHIRSKISFLYASQYSWLRSWLKDKQYLDRPLVMDEMVQVFKEIKVYDSAIPIDYESLKTNNSFKAAISHYRFTFELTHRFYSNIIDDVQQLIQDIENEISRLE